MTLSVVVTVEARPLVRSFQVSHLTTAVVDVVTLRLSAGDGADGFGEVAADAGYHQDGPSIAAHARELAAGLAADPAGIDVERLEAALAAVPASVPPGAVMLVEMAFLDRAARLRGLPVWKLLGLPEPGVVQLMTTVPIGEPIPDSGPLKIKLGSADDGAVLDRLIGVPGPVVLDVNRGWTADDWRAVRAAVARIAPAVLEDPVGDLALLDEVRAALPGTAVILDEGVDSRADVEHAAAVADGANVKLMKLGGLLPARRALQHLTERGATRMLGCYLEPPHAIAYAAQCAGLADWTDLDGHFWLSAEHPAVLRYQLDSSAPGIPRITSVPS